MTPGMVQQTSSTLNPKIRICPSGTVQAVYRGGDTLEGFVELRGLDLNSYHVKIAFEGTVRTWLSHEADHSSDYRPRAGKFKFLCQKQQVEQTRLAADFDASNFHRVPFRFLIPHELISAKSSLTPEYLKLLPSVRSGRAPNGLFLTSASMEFEICYKITADLFSCFGEISWGVGHDELEISVMPSMKAAPPLQLAYYPSEFSTKCERTLRKHIWGRSMGTIQSFSTEPEPINLAVTTPRAATVVYVKLVWQIHRDSEGAASPHEWEITSKYHVKARTFCSTRPFKDIPTISAASTNPNIEMRTQNLASESRQCKSLGWRQDRLTGPGTIEAGRNSKRWVTFLQIPVNVSKRTVPTFLSQICTRRYSLELSLHIAGMFHYPLELEVPVQILFGDSQKSGAQPEIADELPSLHMADAGFAASAEKLPKYSYFD